MDLRLAPLHEDVADGPEGGVAHWLTCADGVRIRVAHWTHTGAQGTVLLFPGRTEYIEKYGRTVRDLRDRGFATISVDWRGQGLADRLIDDRDSGFVGKFEDYQLDVAAVLEAAHTLGLPQPFYLLAHSMGGQIGLRALWGGLPVNAACFSAPMWGIQMSAVMRPAAWAMSWVSRKVGMGGNYAPGTKQRTYVLDAPFDGNSLTTDAEMWRYMVDQATSYPDLTLGGPSMHWLHEALKDTASAASKKSPDVPCLTFLGDQEQIVDPAAIHRRMDIWPKGTLRMIENAEHEVLMENPSIRALTFDEMAAHFGAHTGTTPVGAPASS